MTNDAVLILCALAGAGVGTLIGLLPGVHIYAIVAGLWLFQRSGQLAITPEMLAFAGLGLVIGWTLGSIVPGVFFFAPGDEAPGWVLPGTKLLLRGQGLAGVAWQNAGALGALLGLLAFAPLFDAVVRPLRAILQPHLAWMLVAVMCFLLIGEWPRADMRNPVPLRRLMSAWAYLLASLLVFVLSGVLGWILARHSPLPADVHFQSMLPAFSGLFALPGIAQIWLFGRAVPQQSAHLSEPPSLIWVVRGVLTGMAGGFFAGFLPVISGGIGSVLAGHATAQRDDRAFMVANGASRMTYTLFSALLLFLPGVTLTRGGLSALLSTTWLPSGWRLFWIALAALGFCSVFAVWLQWRCAGLIARVAHQLPLRPIALASGLPLIGVVWAFTGWVGLLIMAVACTIGLLPVLFGTRRLNCLGVILVPVTLGLL